MRRNEQTVPSMQKGGALLRNEANGVLLPVGLKRYAAGGEMLGGISDVLKKTAQLANERNKYEEEKNRLYADAVLNEYKLALSNAKNPEEFDSIATSIDGDVKNVFSLNEGGKIFFEKYGNKLLEENRKDIEKIRNLKEYDFGKNSLKSMLANNQSMLVNAMSKKGDVLLSRGVDEINKTKFLDDKERDELRKEYLTTGILNLALSDENEAYNQAKKYMADVDDGLVNKIGEISKFRKLDEENKLNAENKKKFIKQISDATSLWQQKERGEIGNAEFFVLSSQYDDEIFGKNNSGDLVDAYKILKKMNNGNELSNDEIKNAENGLINAYKKGKMGFDQVASLQNKIIEAQSDSNLAKRFFDNDIEEFVDSVFVKDVEATDFVSKKIMEDKARLGLDIYETYYGKKMALFQDFINQGGILNSQAEKVLGKKALEETKNELGYKENIGLGVSVAELKPLLRQYYSGNNEEEVWENFYKQALFSDNKKEVLKNVARQQQRIELGYPKFNSLREVEEASLNTGDKFYLNGRLTVKG